MREMLPCEYSEYCENLVCYHNKKHKYIASCDLFCQGSLCPEKERYKKMDNEIREKIKKGELICPLCNKPIREYEILASTGPESFYHWHCLHTPNHDPLNPACVEKETK